MNEVHGRNEKEGEEIPARLVLPTLVNLPISTSVVRT